MSDAEEYLKNRIINADKIWHDKKYYDGVYVFREDALEAVRLARKEEQEEKMKPYDDAVEKIINRAKKIDARVMKEEQKQIAIGIGLPFQYAREVTEDILTCQKLRNKEIDLDMALKLFRMKQINIANDAVARVRLVTAKEILNIIKDMTNKADDQTNKGSEARRNFYADRVNTLLSVYDKIKEQLSVKPQSDNDKREGVPKEGDM